MGKDTYRGCALESITLPFVGESKDGKGKTHFGYIFGASSYASNQYCVPASLKSVIITGGTHIGINAFSNCRELTHITLPNGVTSIGNNAFEGCSGLTDINIPNSVTGIRHKAFKGCSGLTSIEYDGTKKQWDAIVKNDEWDKDTGDYTVYFSRGLIKKMKKEK